MSYKISLEKMKINLFIPENEINELTKLIQTNGPIFNVKSKSFVKIYLFGKNILER